MAKKTQVIVIGGSIAGMLAARVLSDYFDHVTIIERDELPDAPVPRNGVPQDQHLHVLLERGQNIIESLLPGLFQELREQGVPEINWGTNTIYISPGGETPPYTTVIRTSAASRVLLEHTIRQRVQQIPNIRWRARTRVERLLHDNGRIVGIEARERSSKDTLTLPANLVVDASGRGSKTPQWLQQLGYNAPEETRVDAHIGYATRWYEMPAGFDTGWTAVVIQSDVAQGNMRAGGMFRAEDNQVVLTLQGMNRDYPPTDEDEFRQFARTLQAPHLYEFIKQARPLSPIYGYRRTHNRMLHYERLASYPENLAVIGDAYCGFNPIYGQGMSSAAMQVIVLRDVLESFDAQNLDGFAAQFRKQANDAVRVPWLMATSEDLRYPATEGDEPGWLERGLQHYSGWILDVSPHDPVVARAFVKSMHLTAGAFELLKPQILLRVLWHKFLQPKPRRPSEMQRFCRIQASLA